MRLITTISEMRSACGESRTRGKRLGFVPTMGALHEGHLSLVRAARGQSDLVAASIFVNPLQFGPQEDLTRYPRDLAGDRAKLAAEGVELVFAPDAQEMYPEPVRTTVQVEGLSGRLCGGSRPGHFRGVATVVSKLFHIVEPDCAFFGQKDAAQAAIIKRMVRDLNFAVEIVVCPTMREADGLAMSSRNRYLSSAERKSATVLYRVLRRVGELAEGGERRAEELLRAGREAMAQEPAVRLDYLEIVHPDTLEQVESAVTGSLVAVAAFVGSTRLMDNLQL